MLRTTSTLLVAAALAVSAAHAASADLSYGPAAGAAWSIRLETKVDVPLSGTKITKVTYDLSCSGNDGGDSQLALHMPATTIGQNSVGPVDATFALSPEGNVSRLQSAGLTNPSLAPLLRNVGLIFPRLPGGPVEVGAVWDEPTVIFISGGDGAATAKAPKLPPQIRLDGTYRLVKVTGDTAEISMMLKEAAGEPIKVDLKGVLTVDLAAKRPGSSSLAGSLKVRKALMTFTVPLTITSTLVP